MKKKGKKKWIIIAVILVVLASYAMQDDQETKPQQEKQKATVEREAKDESTEDRIRNTISKRVSDEFISTSIDDIRINGEKGEFIVLVDLTFDASNTAETTKEVISMSSEDLAAVLGRNDDVKEVCVFWDVPYLKGDAKVSYERKGSGMVMSDQIYNF